MNFYNIPFFLFGFCAVVTGSATIYYEGYRNIQWISSVSIFILVLGWLALMISFSTQLAMRSGRKTLYKDYKREKLKERGITLLSIIIYFVLVVMNIVTIENLGDKRTENFLKNGNTATAKAVVNRIQIRTSRSSASYYAIFQYTVNGVVVEHPWYEEHVSDFLQGDKYRIKYVIDHPEMMTLINKLDR